MADAALNQIIDNATLTRTPPASQKDGLEAAYGANHGKIGAFTGEY